MKFEIDPNELTTDQRAHVAAFITGWPISQEESRVKRGEPFEQHAAITYEHVTEEHRLDAEQKRDMDTTGELREISRAAQADNLDAIFGTPDVAKGTPPLIPDIPYHTVPLDKEGLPWDSRIHSSSKAMIADGSWKLRRGVDPAEVENVKAQLKELMAVPTVTKPSFTLEVPKVPVDLHVPKPPAPVIVGMDLDAGTDTTVTTQIPPAAPKSHYLIDQAPAVTLTDLIGRMSKAIAENRLTQANVTEICTKHGVSEFHLLSNRPDLVPLIDADMKAMGV